MKNFTSIRRYEMLKNKETGEATKLGQHWNYKNFRNKWGTWVAQLVKHPTSARVMISRFVSSSSASGSVLTARSLEPASDSVSLSLCPSPAHALSGIQPLLTIPLLAWPQHLIS